MNIKVDNSLIFKVCDLYNMKSELSKKMPLHSVIWDFKEQLEKKSLTPIELKDLADKIHILSQRKNDYYQSNRFGFIKRIFSCLRNLFKLGTFKSSGQLGLDLSLKYVVEYAKNNKPEKSAEKLDTSRKETIPPKNDVLPPQKSNIQETAKRPEKVVTATGEGTGAENTTLVPEPGIDMAKNQPFIAASSPKLKKQNPTPKKDIENPKPIKATEDEGEKIPKKTDALSKDQLPKNVVIIEGEKEVVLPQSGATNANRLPSQIVKPVVKESINETLLTQNDALSKDELPKNVVTIEQGKDLTLQSDGAKTVKDDVQNSDGIPEEDEAELLLNLSGPVVHSPHDQMIDTCKWIWKHASPKKRKAISDLWNCMIKSGKVIGWEPTKQKHEYQLKLEKELSGTHQKIPIPMTSLIIKKDLKIQFLEELIPGTKEYRQVIQFPDKGLVVRTGMGWLAKDTPLPKIVIEEEVHTSQILCKLSMMGQEGAIPSHKAEKFWNEVNWKV